MDCARILSAVGNTAHLQITIPHAPLSPLNRARIAVAVVEAEAPLRVDAFSTRPPGWNVQRVSIPTARAPRGATGVLNVVTDHGSTKFFANALIQYNGLDNILSANIRLNYINRPGSDFFLVFTEERGSAASLSRFQNRGLVSKLTYLSRF